MPSSFETCYFSDFVTLQSSLAFCNSMPVLKYFLFIMNLIMGRSFTLNFVLEANSVGLIQMFNMFNGVIITEQI